MFVGATLFVGAPSNSVSEYSEQSVDGSTVVRIEFPPFILTQITGVIL